jgi:hypothetical protein
VRTGVSDVMKGIKIRADRAGHQWLMPVIIGSWETEIRRIGVKSQPLGK